MEAAAALSLPGALSDIAALSAQYDYVFDWTILKFAAQSAAGEGGAAAGAPPPPPAA